MSATAPARYAVASVSIQSNEELEPAGTTPKSNPTVRAFADRSALDDNTTGVANANAGDCATAVVNPAKLVIVILSIGSAVPPPVLLNR